MGENGKDLVECAKTHRVSSECSLVEFADATVNVAREIFDEEVAKIVRGAWDKVGAVKVVSGAVANQ